MNKAEADNRGGLPSQRYAEKWQCKIKPEKLNDCRYAAKEFNPAQRSVPHQCIA